MVKEGLSVYICTSPILTSLYCAQEKVYILYYIILYYIILYEITQSYLILYYIYK